MSNTRDYVGNAPRKKKQVKRNATTNRDGDKGNYIRFAFVLVLVITILGVMFVMHKNKKLDDNTTSNTKEKSTVVTVQKPTEKYSYRELLENSEVKTNQSGKKDQNRNTNNNSGNNNQRKLIIEKNPNMNEIRARNESRAEEAKRAQDILNGSLNTPKVEQVRTVKIDQNGQAIIVQDGNMNKDHNNKVLTNEKNSEPTNKSVPVETKNAKTDTKPSNTQFQTVKNPSQEQKVVKTSEKKVQPITTEKNQKTEKLSPVYVMQCGSFKTNEQADVLKNKVVGKGQRSYIQKVVIKSEIWYRVMIGPFATKNLAGDVYTKLKSAKIVSSCNIMQNK